MTTLVTIIAVLFFVAYCAPRVFIALILLMTICMMVMSNPMAWLLVLPYVH